MIPGIKTNFIFLFLLLIVAGVVSAGTAMVDDANYNIICDKDVYHVISGTTYAYCNVTVKTDVLNKELSIGAYLEQKKGVSLSTFEYVNTTKVIINKTSGAILSVIKSPTTAIIDTKTIPTKIGLTSIDKASSYDNVSKNDIIQLKIPIVVTNNKVNDEFWVLVSDGIKELQLDPAVVGCDDTDPFVFLCAYGTYTGNWINTTKNITIDGATIDGTAGNYIRMNTTVGTINISNSTLNAGTTSPILTLEAGNIRIKNSILNAMEGADVSGAVGIINMTATNNIYFNNATLNAYGTAPRAGCYETNGACCQTGLRCSSGSTYLYAINLYINNSKIYAYGSSGTSDLGYPRCNGGHSTIFINATTDYIINNTQIKGYGGTGSYSGSTGSTCSGGDTNNDFIATNIYSYNDSYDLHGGEGGVYKGLYWGAGGTADLVISAFSTKFIKPSYFNTDGFGWANGYGSSQAKSYISTLIKSIWFMFDNTTYSNLRDVPIHNYYNFTNTTISTYKFGVFNLTEIQDNLTIWCAQSGILEIGNDTPISSKIIVNSSCGTPTYVGYAEFLSGINIGTPTLNYSGGYLVTDIYVNATDNYNNTIQYVNFTLTNPLGALVIDNVNGTHSGTIWNTTFFAASIPGLWNLTIYADNNETLFGPSVSIWSFNVTNNGPTVNDILPGNGTYSNFYNITFNVSTAFGTTNGLANCSLYHNFDGTWKINYTKTTGFTSGWNFLTSMNVSDGENYIWNIRCWDNTTLLSDSHYDWYDYNFTLTINKPYMDNCTLYTTRFLNVTIKDEKNESLIWTTVAYVFNYTAGAGHFGYNGTMSNMSWNESTQRSYQFCIHPSYANFTSDIFMRFVKSGYDTRDYIMVDEVIDNSTTLIDVYMLATGLATDTTVHVVDDSDNNLFNVFIQCWKWRPATNDYILVESHYTDYEGNAIFGIETGIEYYMFKFFQEGDLKLTRDKAQIVTTPIEVILQELPYNWYQEREDILDLGNVSYDNDTQMVWFTWEDIFGDPVADEYCLNITNLTDVVYANCSTDVNGSFNFSADVNQTYTIIATASHITSGIWRQIDALVIDTFESWRNFGKDLGLGLSVIFILLVSLLFLKDATMGIIGVVTSIIMLNYFRFLPLNIMAVGGIIAIGIIMIMAINWRKIF